MYTKLTSGGAWVDVEDSFLFEHFQSVGVASDEDVDTQLSLKHLQGSDVSPGDQLVAVAHAD